MTEDQEFLRLIIGVVAIAVLVMILTGDVSTAIVSGYFTTGIYAFLFGLNGLIRSWKAKQRF